MKNQNPASEADKSDNACELAKQSPEQNINSKPKKTDSMNTEKHARNTKQADSAEKTPQQSPEETPNKKIDGSTWISTKDASECNQCAQSTLKRWIKSGELESHQEKAGSTHLVDPERVAAILQSNSKVKSKFHPGKSGDGKQDTPTPCDPPTPQVAPPLTGNPHPTGATPLTGATPSQVPPNEQPRKSYRYPQIKHRPKNRTELKSLTALIQASWKLLGVTERILLLRNFNKEHKHETKVI